MMRRACFAVGAIVALLASNPASAQVFGPDAFGYLGSRTNTGAAYTPIKGNGGTLQTPADPANATFDDRFYTAPIGFNFPFYGVNQTSVFMMTNGFLSFGGTTNTSGALNTQENFSYTNGSFNTNTLPIGNSQVDRAIIAPWWDDLQFTSGQPGGIYTLLRTVAGHQEFVMEWNNVAFFNSTTDGVNFEAILRDDGLITFQYNDVASSNAGNTLGGSATIGIHNLGGTTGNNNFLQFSVNSPTLVQFDQITFTPTAVPEPTSMALCGVAVVGFGFRQWRKRKAAKA